MSIEAEYNCWARDAAGNTRRFKGLPSAEIIRQGFKIFSGQLTLSLPLNGDSHKISLPEAAQESLRAEIGKEMGQQITGLRLRLMRAKGGVARLDMDCVLPALPPASQEMENECHQNNMLLAGLRQRPEISAKISILLSQYLETAQGQATWLETTQKTAAANAPVHKFKLESIIVSSEQGARQMPALRISFTCKLGKETRKKVRVPPVHAVLKPIIREYIGGATSSMWFNETGGGISDRMTVQITPANAHDQKALISKLQELCEDAGLRQKIADNVTQVLEKQVNAASRAK